MYSTCCKTLRNEDDDDNDEDDNDEDDNDNTYDTVSDGKTVLGDD
jgi:hypothetical protein